jgi:hypothetical protein
MKILLIDLLIKFILIVKLIILKLNYYNQLSFWPKHVTQIFEKLSYLN